VGVGVGYGDGGGYVGAGRGYGGWGYGGYYGSPYYSGWGNRWYGDTSWPSYYGYSGSWYYPQTGFSYGTPSYYAAELPPSFAPDYYSENFSQPTMANNGMMYGAGAPENANAAFVTVRVPPDANIWFENYQSHQKGLVRNFISPPLNPGQQYVYDIKAEWMQNGKKVDQVRHVTVWAGGQTNVEFLPQGQQPMMGQSQSGTMYGAPGFNQPSPNNQMNQGNLFPKGNQPGFNPNQPNGQFQNNPSNLNPTNNPNAPAQNQFQGAPGAPLPGNNAPGGTAPAGNAPTGNVPSGTAPAPGVAPGGNSPGGTPSPTGGPSR
jgi:uncharacterized protein (TIGR03000 family)